MTDEKPVILVDMDDVLAHCCQALLTEVKLRFGVDLKREDVRHHSLEHDVHKIDPTIPTEAILAPIREPSFFSSLEVIEGAQEGVQKLLDLGMELVVVTKVPHHQGRSLSNPLADKFIWLERHFPYFTDTKNFIATGRKDLVAGDILIDDATRYLLAHPRPAIVFDAPWNREIKHLPRACGWAEVPELCKEILRRNRDAGKDKVRPISRSDPSSHS